MDVYESIAGRIFRRYGLTFETAERAGGWTNAVWLNGGFALRLSKERESDRIRREVERSKFLPVSAGYPRNIAVGVTDGYEWSLSERIGGEPLRAVWNGLSWRSKSAAVERILAITDSVHSVAAGEVEQLTGKSAWYSSFDKQQSLADVERHVSKKYFTPEQGRILCDILERFYDGNSRTPCVFCHGDITVDNLLWNKGEVVSLLDFEHAVMAPPQLDLHSVVGLALFPFDESTSADILLPDRRDPAIQSYVSEMIPLFRPYLKKQSEKDLFVGYHVLYRQRFFEFWLDRPDGDIKQCDAYLKLLSLCDGSGGYLKSLLQ